MTVNLNLSDSVAAFRWSCRRGMLELDLLLGQFLDNGFSALSEEERLLFKEFLVCTDQELLAWLMGQALPSEPKWLPLIRKIREVLPCSSS